MVVLINGERYACASCIRGHRVKKCDHKDRPLVAIVKRGRQVSQCNHCRHLRKTNGSHVKCTCAMSGAPNPITGCLCEVINDCSCVASHLRQVKVDDDSFDLGTLSSSISPEQTFAASSTATMQQESENERLRTTDPEETLTVSSAIPVTEAVTDRSQSYGLLPPNQPPHSTQVDDNVSTLQQQAPTTILLGEQDKDLANFLFNDLDQFLT